jgi:hypothetical protein
VYDLRNEWEHVIFGFLGLVISLDIIFKAST